MTSFLHEHVRWFEVTGVILRFAWGLFRLIGHPHRNYFILRYVTAIVCFAGVGALVRFGLDGANSWGWYLAALACWGGAYLLGTWLLKLMTEEGPRVSTGVERHDRHRSIGYVRVHQRHLPLIGVCERNARSLVEASPGSDELRILLSNSDAR